MGLRGAPATPMSVEGLPSDDPDETPPGRAAVSYGGGGDALFSSPDPSAATGVDTGSQDPNDLGGLMGLLGGMLGEGPGGGDSGTQALLAQLRRLSRLVDEDELAQHGLAQLERHAVVVHRRPLLADGHERSARVAVEVEDRDLPLRRRVRAMDRTRTRG